MGTIFIFLQLLSVEIMAGIIMLTITRYIHTSIYDMDCEEVDPFVSKILS